MELIRIHTMADAEALFLDAIRYEASIIPENNPVHIGIPGGRSVKPLMSALPRLTERIVSRVYLHLIDERLFGAYNRDALLDSGIRQMLDNGVLKPEQFHTPDVSLTAELCLRAYEASIPMCSLFFIGVGEDGHVASLFPEDEAMHHTGDAAIITRAPKPPRERLTLTPHYFRKHTSVSRVFLLFFGESKQTALTRFMVEEHADALPALIFKGFSHVTIVTDQEI